MEVFMVKNDWATQDDSGCSVKLFTTYNKAKKYYNDTVKEQKDKNWSYAFENGNIKDNYAIDECEDYFEIFEDNFYASSHTCITLTKEEVI